jgi:hypothetical protein
MDSLCRGAQRLGEVDAILSSGRDMDEELLRLAADHDPGFDRLLFAEALATNCQDLWIKIFS